MSEAREYNSIYDAFTHLYPRMDPQIAERTFLRRHGGDEVEVRDLEYRQAWCTASAAYYGSMAELARRKEVEDHRHVLNKLDQAEPLVFSMADTRDYVQDLIRADFAEAHKSLMYDNRIPDDFRNRMSNALPNMKPKSGDPHFHTKLDEIAEYVKQEYQAWRASLPSGEGVRADTADAAVVFKGIVDEFESLAAHARNLV